MRKAAREHAADDRKRRDQIEKLNRADSLIFSTEKNLKDYGEKLPEDKRVAIEGALERLKSVHKSENVEELESAIEQLNAAWSAASEDLYRAQQPEGAGDEAPAGDGASDPGGAAGVQDADFEVVDEGDAK
jgi:molecular chaperone DnaK